MLERNRDNVVIATKVFNPMRRGRNAWGLSRKAIMAELEASLRRLDMDYIDPPAITLKVAEISSSLISSFVSGFLSFLSMYAIY